MSQSGLKSLINGESISQPDTQPAEEVMYTTVYTFVVYDHDKGTTITYPKMATRQTIANMRGKVNEETAWVVDVAELDSMGFYAGEKTPDKS